MHSENKTNKKKNPARKSCRNRKSINQLVRPRRASNQTVTATASCPKPQGAGDISFTNSRPCLFVVAETPEKCARAAETIATIVKHCHTLGLVSCRSAEMPTRKTRRQKPPTAAEEDGGNQKTTMGQAPPWSRERTKRKGHRKCLKARRFLGYPGNAGLQIWS